MSMQRKKFLESLSKFYTVLGFIFILGSVILIAIPTYPYLLYNFDSDKSGDEVSKLSKDLFENPIIPEEIEEKNYDLPDFDPSLPEQNYISIPSIGVYAPLAEAQDPEDVLTEGAWIGSNYGYPDENDLPIIVAAHRFGYVSWSRDKRNTLSFYKLPKTDSSDRVEIIWNQRKYIYAIYNGDESTYIKDYSADLILYTCKYFNTPQRIFRYAKRIN